MLITCTCLNVSIDVKGDQNDLPNVDKSSLNLSQAEGSEGFFKEELKEIEIVQVTKQVKSLVHVKIAGTWLIEHCLNCSTNCFSTSPGRTTALVNAALITNVDVIGRMKTYKDYSPVFRIIVKPLVTENNSNLSDLRQSPQKVQTALSSLQKQVNEAIREQVTKTEEKIRLFTEQQYSQLDEFRNRATKDHKAVAQRIYEALPQLDKEANGSTAGENDSNLSDNVAASVNRRVLSKRKTDTFSADGSQASEPRGRPIPNRSGNTFVKNSLDSEGLFVLEGMEDSIVYEPGHSEGDSDTDHDDSGSHDEGIDVHRNRTSSIHLAKSLPVNVPFYSIPASGFDKEEESMDAVDIAASIKALASSLHGDAVFGDLPRPRFSTQI